MQVSSTRAELFDPLAYFIAHPVIDHIPLGEDDRVYERACCHSFTLR